MAFQLCLLCFLDCPDQAILFYFTLSIPLFISSLSADFPFYLRCLAWLPQAAESHLLFRDFCVRTSLCSSYTLPQHSYCLRQLITAKIWAVCTTHPRIRTTHPLSEQQARVYNNPWPAVLHPTGQNRVDIHAARTA